MYTCYELPRMMRNMFASISVIPIPDEGIYTVTIVSE